MAAKNDGHPTKMKIIADDKIPFLRGALEPVAEVIYKEGKSISRADVMDCDAIITRTRTRCDASLLEGTAVRGIFTATIGFDHIDTAYCQRAGIYWENAPACNSRSVEQYIGSALAVLKLRHGLTLRGKTIAVVGVGHVGSLVAALCEKLGMRVLRVDPPRAEAEGKEGFTTYEEALPQADIVTYHTPLTAKGPHPTLHLLGSDAIAMMKQGVVVINSSRGPVCGTRSLVSGLRNGRIGHAVIDVWENEPDINRDLLSLATIATPHIAGYSTDSKLRGTVMAVSALCRHFGLKTPWTPPALPAPANPTFDPSGAADAEEAAARMFLHVYDIEADCYMLRERTNEFERLRGDYHLRREIGSFSLMGEDTFGLKQFGIK